MNWPILQLPDGVIAGLCVVNWAAWSIAMGYVGHRLPLELLETDTWLTQQRRWEQEGHWYNQVLQIKRWKDSLPEAGDFFPGGFRKRSVGGGDTAVMSRFLVETRRAEYVHIAIWMFWPMTMLWTPGWGVVVNLSVGTAFNLPCLLVQRYNRIRLQRVLAIKEQLHYRASVY